MIGWLRGGDRCKAARVRLRATPESTSGVAGLLLQIDQELDLRHGGRVVLQQEIGSGTQGAVWEVKSDRGTSLALKWYHDSAATKAQRAILEHLVSLPAPTTRFLWPMEIVDLPGDSSFGYLMPLRPEGYVGLVDRVAGRVDVSFRSLATTGFELADALLQLHASGLCYRDINFGNVFFNPASGRTAICDNDNVGIDDGQPCSVLGTPYFMAPEIVRGEAFPSARTDRFSLAVLLFYLLIVHHPLEGRRADGAWDEQAMSEAFGRDPVFIFDPDDDSNAPVRGLHDNAMLLWDMYPGFVQDLFVQSFTHGLHDPERGRVTEGVWRPALVRLRDSIVYCPRCAKQNLTDPARASRPCWSCGATLGVAAAPCGRT